MSEFIDRLITQLDSLVPFLAPGHQEVYGVLKQNYYAFADPNRIIAEDLAHSNKKEKRYFCFGKVGSDVMTVRFTYRAGVIRIFGAGYWRKGKKIYEREN